MLNIYITIIVNCIILNTVKVSFALTVLPNPTNVIPDIINNLTQYLSANSVTKLTPNQSAIDLCFMRTDELIRRHGFVSEEYDVDTEDGYNLIIFRCYSPDVAEEDRIPIALFPGMYDSSDTFCLSNNSLAFYLAKRKYDVFIYNPRGNKYSRGHKELDSRIPFGPYWAFSWYEMGYYDLPAVIDKVLNITKKSQLSTVGHSQGGTSIYVLFSERPEYNKKIKFAASIASFTYMTNVGFPLNVILSSLQLFNNFRDFEFVPNNVLQKMVSLFICRLFDGVICNYAIDFILGPSSDKRDAATDVCHYPAGGSFNQVLHYSQGHVFKTFGPMMEIGQYTTRPFDLRNVKVPNAFIYSSNDPHTSKEDVALLWKNLEHNNQTTFVNFPDKNHVDFVWDVTAYEDVYRELVELESK